MVGEGSGGERQALRRIPTHGGADERESKEADADDGAGNDLRRLQSARGARPGNRWGEGCPRRLSAG